MTLQYLPTQYGAHMMGWRVWLVRRKEDKTVDWIRDVTQGDIHQIDAIYIAERLNRELDNA